MVDESSTDGPISRRRLLKGAAVAVIGTTALNTQSNAQPQTQTQNQTQTQTTTTGQSTSETTTPDEPDPPLVYLYVVDSDPADESYSYQTEFDEGATFYPYANVSNINHDGIIRIGIQWYVVGGAGLYDEASDDLFTYTESNSWHLWWPLPTYGDSPEGREWTQGQYTVYLTITDFTTGLSTTDISNIHLL